MSSSQPTAPLTPMPSPPPPDRTLPSAPTPSSLSRPSRSSAPDPTDVDSDNLDGDSDDAMGDAGPSEEVKDQGITILTRESRLPGVPKGPRGRGPAWREGNPGGGAGGRKYAEKGKGRGGFEKLGAMGLMEGATGEKILDREYRRIEYDPFMEQLERERAQATSS